MPVEPTKLKTRDELQEVLNLFVEEQKAQDAGCICLDCRMLGAMRKLAIETIRYVLGEEPKDFIALMGELKNNREIRSKHDASHAE